MIENRLVREIYRLLILPLLLAIWIVEDFARRRKGKKRFQINSYQVSWIFLFYFLLSGYLLTYTDLMWLKCAAIYVLTAMEVLALSLSFIAGWRPINFHRLMQRIGERSHDDYDTREGIYRVIVTFVYNVFYFGLLNFFLYSIKPNAYKMEAVGSSTHILFDFIYNSVSVFTLFNNPTAPVSVIAKVFTIVEVFTGYLFVIFIFASVVSFHTNNLPVSNDKKDK